MCVCAGIPQHVKQKEVKKKERRSERLSWQQNTTKTELQFVPAGWVRNDANKPRARAPKKKKTSRGEETESCGGGGGGGWLKDEEEPKQARVRKKKKPRTIWKEEQDKRKGERKGTKDRKQKGEQNSDGVNTTDTGGKTGRTEQDRKEERERGGGTTQTSKSRRRKGGRREGEGDQETTGKKQE